MRLLALLLFLYSAILAAQTGGKQIIKVGPDFKLPNSPAIKAGDFVYVSGMTATNERGQIRTGDVKEQTRRTLDNLHQVLQAAGSSLAQAASVNVYLRSAADFEAMNEVYRGYWSKDPPARTTVVAGLIEPQALIQISLIAIRNGAERKIILPAGWMKSPNYSYGIKSGDTLFLAGLVARNNRDNSAVTGDINVQTRQVLENAGEILKAAGMTYTDIASSRVFITDAAKFQEMNAAYRPFFPKNAPARATVKAALMNDQYKVEITLLAVQSADRQAIVPLGDDGKPMQLNPNYSSGIRIGNRLFVSGMVGSTPANLGDMKAQTRQSLANIGRTVKAAGFDWSQVVDGVVYITAARDFAAMNEAYREAFAKDFPARTVVVTEIVIPDPLVEIMLTAVR